MTKSPEPQPTGNSRPADTPAADARTLPPPAQRALEEAAARRLAYLDSEAKLPKEIGGRKGLEPGRYGDWEVKGLTSDF